MGLWCSWRFVSFQDNLVNKEKNKKIKTVSILTLDSRQQRIGYRSETIKRKRKGMEKMEMMFRFLVLLLMNELLLCIVESKGNIHYYDFLVSTNYFSFCFFFFFILIGMDIGRIRNGIRLATRRIWDGMKTRKNRTHCIHTSYSSLSLSS